MKTTFRISAIAIAAAIIATAGMAEGPANRDGEFTRAQAMDRTAKRFDRADTDRNGLLSRAEIAAGRDSAQGRLMDRKARSGDPSAKREVGFAWFDGDANGAVSYPEFRAAMGKLASKRGDFSDARVDAVAKVAFSRIDADGSEALSKEEMATGRKHLKN